MLIKHVNGAAASDVQRRCGGVHAAGQPPLPAAFGSEHAEAHLGASLPELPVLGQANFADPEQTPAMAGQGSANGAILRVNCVGVADERRDQRWRARDFRMKRQVLSPLVGTGTRWSTCRADLAWECGCNYLR